MGGVGLLVIGAALVGDDGLALIQPMTGHRDAFLKQSAWILPEIQHQTLNVGFAKLLQLFLYFFARRFSELQHTKVGDARLDKECLVHAVPGDFVANDVERQWFGAAFAAYHDLDLGALRAAEKVCDFGGVQRVNTLVIHFQKHVAWADTGFIGWGTTERSDHDGLARALLRANLHADAVVFAVLLFAQSGEVLGIKEIRVGIEGAQHAWDRALVDALVGRHLVRKILLNQVVDLGERVQAVIDGFVVGFGRCRRDARRTGSEEAAKDGGCNQE